MRTTMFYDCNRALFCFRFTVTTTTTRSAVRLTVAIENTLITFRFILRPIKPTEIKNIIFLCRRMVDKVNNEHVYSP